MKKKPSVKMEDIAIRAGVALSTVSRALNNDRRISSKTKEKIRNIAKEMGFTKNQLASGLMTNKTNTIGVIIPQINRAFFSSTIYSMEETAYKYGYSIIICQSQDSKEREFSNVESLLSMNVDGIIASLAVETDEYSHFLKAKNRGIPVVFFDRVPDQKLNTSNIFINDEKSAYRATEHLINQGYRKIAHVAGPVQLSIFKKRLEGYLKALNDYNLPVIEAYSQTNHFMTHKEGTKSAKYLLNLKDPPDAIFCANNLMAISAISVALDMGINVPEQLGVIGFSEEPTSYLMRPSVTSLKQPGIQMGKQAVELLLSEINFSPEKGLYTYKNIELDTEMNIRESTSRNPI
ncbi:LacI family DNA-binding transcriptional regulator [Membranihabitans maritimus]|uniref:LacI family DNA-binding transcriptional regulator n=1 Tax=Membranihabitans maritimus TaxID=2904244 RepID=UPI001F410D02|nr:LacI family DNA-binding transcriptional regulator [Membranihabitans maritimus]